MTDKRKCEYRYGGLFVIEVCPRPGKFRVERLGYVAYACGIHAKPWRNAYGTRVDEQSSANPSTSQE